MLRPRTECAHHGFTLIDSLVGVAVFVLVAVSVYQAFRATMVAVKTSRTRITATALANEQFEIARNLTFSDVGIVGGLPLGKIPRTQTLVRDGVPFVVITTIRNIDDPFDGTIGGVPNDLSAADYKLVALDISCQSCRHFPPLRFTTWVGPNGLETASTNGALFIEVFDAVGQPVQGALVHVENNQAVPPITIDDTTNNAGMLQIVDAPPGVEAYDITISKPGYSSERTYQTGVPENPNPAKPHATVALQQLTEISFSIDRVSTLDVTSSRDTCAPVASIDFALSGSKLIGTIPDILKFSAPKVTDGIGRTTISNLEWDTYNVTPADGAYDLAGTIPLLPITLNPNSTQDLRLVVVPKDPQSILFTIKDASTQLPLSDASVQLQSGGYDTTLVTGRGFLRQTDWSGGSGQTDFIDPSRYFANDGNIDDANPAGEVRLKQIIDVFAPAGQFISSTFDTGSTSTFHQILWQPQSQPPAAGTDPLRLQVATNNDNATWNFAGPDGSANTYFTLTDQNIHPAQSGKRYLRYMALLQTASTTWTPNVSDVSFTFTSLCVPPGQTLFTGLAAGDYNVTVSKTGYQSFTDTVTISAPWQQREITLSP